MADPEGRLSQQGGPQDPGPHPPTAPGLVAASPGATGSRARGYAGELLTPAGRCGGVLAQQRGGDPTT